MKKLLILILCMPVFLSCNRQQDQTIQNTYAPKVVEAKGYLVPKDSMVPPKIKPEIENNPENMTAGSPIVAVTNANVYPVGIPKTITIRSPRICIPGRDPFLLPKVIPALDSPYAAGIPEVIVAKDASSKDQNPQNFSTFGKLQGLKESSVSSLLEDRSGNVWIGSVAGATKYDGKNFTFYGDKEGLGSGASCSLEDRSGNLWFASNGAIKYDGKNFTWYSGRDGLSDERIHCIAEDSSGNVWFGTNGNGAIKYDGKSFTHFTDKEGIADSFVHCILTDRTGNIWFGTAKGISKYDGKSFENFSDTSGALNSVVSAGEDKAGNLWFGTSDKGVIKYDGKSFSNFTDAEGLSYNDVRSILQDRSGNIWFGTNGGGLTKLDGSGFMHLAEKEGLPGNSVDCMLEDRSGNLWIGMTNTGVSKYGGKSFTHFTIQEGLPANDGVYSIYEDRNANIWLGMAGGGVSKYDGKSFAGFGKKEGLAENVISITQDKSGNMWFGTTRGFVRYDGKVFTHYTDKDGMFNGFVFTILQDKSGNMWFGTAGGGVSKFDGKTFAKYSYPQGLADNFIRTMFEDKSGNIWFGTRGGVSKYDGKLFTNFSEKDGLANDAVVSISQDSSGNMWFATRGGVTKYDGKYFTNFTEKEGLPSNYITSILADRAGNIWIGSRFGLSKLTRDKLDFFTGKVKANTVSEGDVFFKNYHYDDGFLGIGVSGNSLCEDKNGNIWVGANDRVTVYHPSGGEQVADTNAISVQVTGIKLFSENIPWVDLLKNHDHVKDTSFHLSNGVMINKFKYDGLTKWYNLPEHLSLAYNNNFLTFDFIGITMNQPKNVKYQYKLEGIDDYWSGISSSTQAPYGNLPSGTYTFKVKAMNSEGYWGKEFQYIFTIRPPWWKTWWAYVIYFLAITGTIWYYIKWRERALKERQRILEKTVIERTAEVVAGKKLSDDLLLNILPSEVAEELKQKGSAEAKQFDEVTVMFTDFKNFTQISEKLTPVELVAEIHTCFKAFDDIISRYNIEKIKTIGDSYMCAGGLPVANKTHPQDVVSAALEIQQFIHAHFSERLKEGKEPFEIRIGVHTGQVVAGIVGVKKFAYDIWGDTVNIASRMESSGEAGKVNISGSTFELVKYKFNCTHRGKIDAKHKGMIDMYFVDSYIL